MQSCLAVRYEGRVQGVGFRYTVQHLARQAHLSGFVRNESDGSVTMEVYGEKGELEDFLGTVRRSRVGPYIDKAYTNWRPTSGPYEGFEIRYH